MRDQGGWRRDEGGQQYDESAPEREDVGGWPGRRTLASYLQRQGTGPVPDPERAHEEAAAGVAGAGQALPHLEQIQRSFGHHDVGDVRAQTGGAAADASRALGAEAYAFGSAVAFRDTPSLHTAAHEAAHVVQQRAGVVPGGGIGADGDAHEQHADAVADRVVRGESAEELLDQAAGGAAGVQAKRKAGDLGQALAVQFRRQHAGSPALQLRSSNGVNVSGVRFAPNELPADGTTTSQGSVNYSGRIQGGAKINWSIVGDAFGATVSDVGLVTPGNAITAGKDSVRLQVKAQDSKEAGAWDAGFITLWDTKFLQAKKDYPKFISRNYTKNDWVSPGTGWGKFDAVYSPRARSLSATVKVKFDFLNDKPKAAKWSTGAKRSYVSTFMSQARRAWTGQYQFENIREPKSIWGKLGPVNVRVQGKEDNAAPHFTITVHKKDFRPFVDPAGPAEFGPNQINQNFPNTGQAEQDQLNAKLAGPVLFAPGSADIPAADRNRIEFAGTYLHSMRSPKFNVTITGHAKKDAAATTPAQLATAAQAAKTLSRQRATNIKAAIAAKGTGSHRLRVSAQGDTGADATAAWDKAEMNAVIQPGFVNRQNLMAHEFGHMLGLHDEYTEAGLRAPGALTGHHALTQTALGTDYADTFAKAQDDSENIMNGGNDVRPHHYVTMWEVLAASATAAPEPVPPFGQADWHFVGM